jgi:hypothetical protein
MLIFGEIKSFDTPWHDPNVSEYSSILILFNSVDEGQEATVVSRGTVITDKSGRKSKMFGFNRPFTRNYGEKLILQVIQIHEDGSQSLVGYGFCDLVINQGKYSRDISVGLWRPKSENELINKLRGTFNPFVHSSLVLLPPQVDRSEMQSVASLGKVRIHIQRLAYK